MYLCPKKAPDTWLMQSMLGKTKMRCLTVLSDTFVTIPPHSTECTAMFVYFLVIYRQVLCMKLLLLRHIMYLTL